MRRIVLRRAERLGDHRCLDVAADHGHRGQFGPACRRCRPATSAPSPEREAVIDGRPVFIVTLPETVLFDVGQAVLRPAAEPSLQDVVGLVGEHPGARTEVQGHTDSVGSADFNQSLSERRAAAVSDWLAGHGVAPGTLTKAGYGATRPVADNATPEGRQANRRVEIIVHLASIGRPRWRGPGAVGGLRGRPRSRLTCCGLRRCTTEVECGRHAWPQRSSRVWDIVSASSISGRASSSPSVMR